VGPLLAISRTPGAGAERRKGFSHEISDSLTADPDGRGPLGGGRQSAKHFWKAPRQRWPQKEAGFQISDHRRSILSSRSAPPSCPEVSIPRGVEQAPQRDLVWSFAVICGACHKPVYVAERVATIDVLRQRRVELGSGRGTVELCGGGPRLRSPTVGPREMCAMRCGKPCSRCNNERRTLRGHNGQALDLPPRQGLPRRARPQDAALVAASNLPSSSSAGPAGLGVIGVSRKHAARPKPGGRCISQGDPQRRNFAIPSARSPKTPGRKSMSSPASTMPAGRRAPPLRAPAAGYYVGDNNAGWWWKSYAHLGQGRPADRREDGSRSDEEANPRSNAVGRQCRYRLPQVENGRETSIDSSVHAAGPSSGNKPPTNSGDDEPIESTRARR